MINSNEPVASEESQRAKTELFPQTHLALRYRSLLVLSTHQVSNIYDLTRQAFLQTLLMWQDRRRGLPSTMTCFWPTCTLYHCFLTSLVFGHLFWMNNASPVWWRHRSEHLPWKDPFRCCCIYFLVKVSVFPVDLTWHGAKPRTPQSLLFALRHSVWLGLSQVPLCWWYIYCAAWHPDALTLLFELALPDLLSFGHLRHGVSGPDLTVLPVDSSISTWSLPITNPYGAIPSVGQLPRFRCSMAPFTMRLLVEYTTFLAATSSTLCTSTSICKPISSDALDAEHLPTTSTVVSSTSTSRMPHYTRSLLTTKITFWLLSISD